MPTATIHIGMPKTATSSIQAALSEARPHLAAHGLVYPGTQPEHSALIAVFHPQGAEHFRFQGDRVGPDQAKAMSQALMAEIAALAARPEPPDLILSSEFLNRFPVRAAQAMRAYFAGLGYDTRILCYVRHPIDQAQSSLMQAVKRGQARIAEREAAPTWHSARATLTRYGEAFGREALIVRDFASAKALGPARDALTQIGFSGPLDAVPDPHVNESLSLRALKLAEIRNRVPRRHGFYFVTNWVLLRIGGPKYQLPEPVRQQIEAAAADDLDWLNREFGLALKSP